MSGILSRLKGDKSLFAKLQETYPTEIVEPYGSCLIVPLKAFNKTQEEKLKSQGLRIYYQGYKGETCAFIVLEKQAQKETVMESSIEEPSETNAEKKPLKTGFWTPEEETIFKELHSQGLSAKQIAERLNRSVFVVAAKFRYLKPQVRKEKKEKPEEAKPESEDPDLVKEFLSACSLLYPSHPKVCAFLLKRASEKILENRQSP